MYIYIYTHTHTHTHYPRYVATARAIFTLVILYINRLTSVPNPYVYGDPPSRFYRDRSESLLKTPIHETRLKISSIIQMNTFFIRPKWKSCYCQTKGTLHHCLHTGNYLTKETFWLHRSCCNFDPNTNVNLGNLYEEFCVITPAQALFLNDEYKQILPASDKWYQIILAVGSEIPNVARFLSFVFSVSVCSAYMQPN